MHVSVRDHLYGEGAAVPDEIAETENQNTDTSELDGLRQRAVEISHVVLELRRQREGAESLNKGNIGSDGNSRRFPPEGPIEWVVLVICRLWNQNTVVRVSRFNEMMGSNISHNLCTGEDFNLKLLLYLVEVLNNI